jgi:hypothetical protein
MAMRKYLLTAPAALLFAASACVGEFEAMNDPGNGGASTPGQTPGNNPGGGGGGGAGAADAKALYDGTVKSLVQTKCGACHGTPAVAGAPSYWPGAEPVYESVTAGVLVGDFTDGQARMLTKGVHSTVTTWWNGDEDAKIKAWLLAEHTWRNAKGGDDPGTNPGPGGGGATAVAQFAGCMTLANWQAANMQTWSQLETQQGGNDPCSSCHPQPTSNYGNMALCNNTEIMFAQNISSGGFNSLFTTDATGKVIIDTAMLQLKGTPSATNTHPAFEVDPNSEHMQALQQFYQLTMSAVAAGNCPKTGFTDPTPACQ